MNNETLKLDKIRMYRNLRNYSEYDISDET